MKEIISPKEKAEDLVDTYRMISWMRTLIVEMKSYARLLLLNAHY
jgi:hypothetical protein